MTLGRQQLLSKPASPLSLPASPGLFPPPFTLSLFRTFRRAASPTPPAYPVWGTPFSPVPFSHPPRLSLTHAPTTTTTSPPSK
mmetsp:Transcript_72553/g.193875  ORF Transcript_72553/g.193875 Transcript_72553/m.193875 type:complete len:83 (+) Transcript_72553:744-992(+)